MQRQLQLTGIFNYFCCVFYARHGKWQRFNRSRHRDFQLRIKNELQTIKTQRVGETSLPTACSILSWKFVSSTCFSSIIAGKSWGKACRLVCSTVNCCAFRDNFLVFRIRAWKTGWKGAHCCCVYIEKEYKINFYLVARRFPLYCKSVLH